VEKACHRGKITVLVQMRAAGGGRRGPELDEGALEEAYRKLARLAKRLGAEPPRIEALLGVPGVWTVPENGTPGEMQGLLDGVLDEALRDFLESRRREGRSLEKDLRLRFRRLESTTQRMAVLVRGAPERLRERLLARLKEAGADVDPADDRWVREAAVLADRADVTEELTRLRTHLVEARRLLDSPAAEGRRLEFLLQEIGREVNTAGNKAGDTRVSRAVVDMKAELEKIREQVQNLE
jgi:uncharacterized protein (TIGR00255 family)